MIVNQPEKTLVGGGGGASREFEPMASFEQGRPINWEGRPIFLAKNYYNIKLKQANNRHKALRLTLNTKQPTYL